MMTFVNVPDNDNSPSIMEMALKLDDATNKNTNEHQKVIHEHNQFTTYTDFYQYSKNN